MTKNQIAPLLVLMFAACDSAEPEPDATPAPDAGPDCPDLCSVEDVDVYDLPSNRCPGGLVEACIAQCIARMPAGDWCAAP